MITATAIILTIAGVFILQFSGFLIGGEKPNYGEAAKVTLVGIWVIFVASILWSLT